MPTIEEIFPPFGLRITAGPVELSAIRDDDIPALVELALAGIHDPAAMPFSMPWTDAEPEVLPFTTAAHHWQARAEFTPRWWSLNFVARIDGEIVGTQGFATSNYLITRTGETGSWLGRAHQGKGVGTAMRRAICAFLFDHLGAAEICSSAFVDNPQSYAVSRRVGYVDDGTERVERRPGELAIRRRLVLRPEAFVRGPDPIVVEGVAAVRRFIGMEGLPAESGEQSL